MYQLKVSSFVLDIHNVSGKGVIALAIPMCQVKVSSLY